MPLSDDDLDLIERAWTEDGEVPTEDTVTALVADVRALRTRAEALEKENASMKQSLAWDGEIIGEKAAEIHGLRDEVTRLEADSARMRARAELADEMAAHLRSNGLWAMSPWLARYAATSPAPEAGGGEANV